MATGTRATRALLAGLVLGTGCAPGTEWDERMGSIYSRQVAAEMGLVHDGELNEYVEALGRRLVEHVGNRRFEYSFHIVDEEVPNAFSLPGGYVYVSRGLLVLTNSPDELANLLGHEIAHVEARHAARRYAAGTLPGLLALPGNVVAAVSPTLGDAMSAPFEEAGAHYIARYSREQEHEADRVGQQLSASAGFDPDGMALLLMSLERQEQIHRARPPEPGFLDSHPPTPDRYELAARRAATMGWARSERPPPNRAAYLQRIDGLVVGENPARGVASGGRILHPVLGCSIEVPDGWTPGRAYRAAGAIAPDRAAIVFVQRLEAARDPRVEAEAFLESVSGRLRVQVERSEGLRAGDLDAWGITALAGNGGEPTTMDVTWIADGDHLFQVTGIAPVDSVEALALIRAAAAGVRPLTADERDSIRVVRLRTATAAPGERLDDLSRRAGNVWTHEETAVANDGWVADPLEAGALVKVAVSEPWGR